MLETNPLNGGRLRDAHGIERESSRASLYAFQGCQRHQRSATIANLGLIDVLFTEPREHHTHKRELAALGLVGVHIGTVRADVNLHKFQEKPAPLLER